MNQQSSNKEIQATISITEENIETIMSTILEDERWAIHQEEQSNWSKKPSGIYQDEWATDLLLQGETLRLTDKRNNSLCSMTLEDLLEGIILSLKEGNINLFQTVTNKSAERIIQYALFKRILYLT